MWNLFSIQSVASVGVFAERAFVHCFKSPAAPSSNYYFTREEKKLLLQIVGKFFLHQHRIDCYTKNAQSGQTSYSIDSKRRICTGRHKGQIRLNLFNESAVVLDSVFIFFFVFDFVHTGIRFNTSKLYISKSLAYPVVIEKFMVLCTKEKVCFLFRLVTKMRSLIFISIDIKLGKRHFNNEQVCLLLFSRTFFITEYVLKWLNIKRNFAI